MRAGRYKQKLEQATAKNKELVGEVAQMGQKMDHAQKETKAMKIGTRKIGMKMASQPPA